MTFEQFCNLVHDASPQIPILLHSDGDSVAYAGNPMAAAFVLYTRDEIGIRIRFAIDQPEAVARQLRALPGVSAFYLPDYPGMVFCRMDEQDMTEQVHQAFKHYLALAITKFFQRDDNAAN